MWRFTLAPSVVLPRLSQPTGMEFQVCMTRISSQCTPAVAKSASSIAIRKDNVQSQWYDMSTGNQRRSATNVGVRRVGLLKTWSAENSTEMQGFMWPFIASIESNCKSRLS